MNENNKQLSKEDLLKAFQNPELIVDGQLKQTPAKDNADPDERKKPAYRRIGVATIIALRNMVSGGNIPDSIALIDEILDY